MCQPGCLHCIKQWGLLLLWSVYCCCEKGCFAFRPAGKRGHTCNFSCWISHFEILNPLNLPATTDPEKPACLLHLLCSENPEILICWVDCASTSLQPSRDVQDKYHMAHAFPWILVNLKLKSSELTNQDVVWANAFFLKLLDDCNGFPR